MQSFFGGNPLAVVLRLVIISIITGIALTAAGFDPRDLYAAIPDLIQAIYDLGFSWVVTVFQYLLLGAVIVVPVWLLVRFLKFISGDTGKGGSGSRT